MEIIGNSLSRQEAYEALKQGHKITHNHFSPDEWYEMKDGKIIAEDGVNHTRVFWSEEHNNWRRNGWWIYQ